MKIRGNTVGTTMKRPDFNQTDERKSDYILNNPIPVVNEEDEGKIPVVEDGAYVLKEKNSILELDQMETQIDEINQDIGSLRQEVSGLDESVSQIGSAMVRLEETTLPELDETIVAHGEAIDGMGNAIDEIYSKANDLETKKVDAYKRVLIDTFTTTEQAIINKDYSSYGAKGMYVKVEVPAGTVANGSGLSFYFTTGSSNNTWCGFARLAISDGSKNFTGYIRCFDEYGYWTTEYYDASANTIKRGISSSDVDNTLPSNLYVKGLKTQNAIPVGVTVTVTLLLPVGEEEI